MLDTDQLRSFLAIIDTGSFTRAADRVAKTQSAVSMHMRRLEEQLGCPLFVKDGRGSKLTPEGEKLVDFARRIIQAESGALAALSRRSLRGTVRFGIPDDYAEFHLADVLTRFYRDHPLVEVSVVSDVSGTLVPAVESGALDLALVTEIEGRYKVECIRESDLVWVASPRFAWDPEAVVPLAIGSHDCIWRKRAEAALSQAGRASRIVLRSNNFSALGPIVRAGLAITVLPRDSVAADLRILGPETGLPPLPTTRMGLVIAPGTVGPSVAALADAVREMLGDGARKAA